jgi:hypothetical protein
VLVVTGHEHGRAEEQVAPLVELGEHGLGFEIGFLLTPAPFPIEARVTDQALVELGERLGGDAVTEVLTDDAAIDPIAPVVIAATVTTGFPGHVTGSEAAHSRTCNTTPHHKRRRTANPTAAVGGSRRTPE